MTREQIVASTGTRYTPANMVVAAAGNLDHATVVELVREAFARSGAGRRPAARRSPHRPAEPAAPVRRTRSVVVRDKDTEQAHLVLGCPGTGPRSTSGGSPSAC